jgi:hypothetical protein
MSQDTTLASAVSSRIDSREKVINVGDTVVYATRKGSETFLKELMVTGLSDQGIQGYDPKDYKRRLKTVKNLTTVAKVFSV